MTRYFYTDPLAAAWMTKHFGMRFGFYDERSYFREYEVPITGDDDFWRADRGRFYVHQECRHHLHLRVGDIVIGPGRGKPQGSPVVVDEQIVSLLPQGVITFPVIQRDGKAFMWPEVEP